MEDGQSTQINTGVTLIAKWGKERITLEGLNTDTTIGNVKDLLSERTGVLQKRQKLIGLVTKAGVKVSDDLVLGDLKPKTGKVKDATEGVVHQFIMMGTTEEQIFVDPAEKDDLPDVVDDFDLDFNAGSSEVRCVCLNHFVSVSSLNGENSIYVVAPTCCKWRKSEEIHGTYGSAYHERTERG